MVSSRKEVAIFNMIDGGPPVRHLLLSNGSLGVGEFELSGVPSTGRAFMCDDYKMFAFGANVSSASYEPVLTVVDFF